MADIDTNKDLLLAIDDLHITVAGAGDVVAGVDLRIHRGEVLALVGESGSGKSMTARAVLGLLPTQAHPSGSITFDGQEILGLSEAALTRFRGSRIAMVFQEPQTALNPARTIGWQLTEAVRAHRRISTRDARGPVLELLDQVELDDPARRFDSYPHQLSGGQKQRVVLAMALAGDPDLLLADEPTTALDVTVQAEILALLQRIRGESRTSILLITHNMAVVAEVADRVMVLQAGQVVEQGPVADLFANPTQHYTRELLGAVLELPDRPGTVHVVPTPEPTANASTEDVTGTEPPALSYRDVVVSYTKVRRRHQSPPAVREVTLDVAPGEVLGLVGESGSGKTTLGRLAAGLVPLTGGTVELAGEDLYAASAKRRRELRRNLAVVHQDPEASLDPRQSVRASIREPLDIHQIGRPAARDTRVDELLAAVRLPRELGSRRPRALSGGQRQRIALARALVLNPSLLIADEPTSALDVLVQADVLELFSVLQQELGFACVFISHDLAVVNRVADTVAVLRAGEVVEHGPVPRVFNEPAHPYTQRLLAAVPRPHPRRRPDAVDRDPRGEVGRPIGTAAPAPVREEIAS